MSRAEILKMTEKLAEIDGWTTRLAYCNDGSPLTVGGVHFTEYVSPEGNPSFDCPYYVTDLKEVARLGWKLNLDIEISSAGTDEKPAIEVGMANENNNVTVQELISDHGNDPVKTEAYARALAILEVMATDGVEIFDE